ncbi:hypothetical protein NC652_031732 [Populus alba x Populus x berolinensis]|nr:hypothetical protein NC652_031732 [Populus alba x Populus x berolinensis]
MRTPITLRNCGLILMVLCILWIPSRVSSSENKVTPIYDPRDIEQRFEDWLAQYGREYELETNGHCVLEYTNLMFSSLTTSILKTYPLGSLTTNLQT